MSMNLANINYLTAGASGSIVMAMSVDLPRKTNIWNLLVTAAAVIAFIVVAAVLAFEVMEFLYYGKAPSVWPAP